MTASLGRFLILASVLVSAAGAFIGFAAGQKQSPEGLKWARRFAYAFAAQPGEEVLPWLGQLSGSPGWGRSVDRVDIRAGSAEDLLCRMPGRGDSATY